MQRENLDEGGEVGFDGELLASDRDREIGADCRPELNANVPCPMLMTLLGIMRLARIGQKENAASSIVATWSGIVTPVRLGQSENAPYPH